MPKMPPINVKSLHRVVLATALAASFVLPSLNMAQAQQRSVPIVRDAEIESLVREYASPILKAAGLGNAGIQIVLVNDPSFNAFVTGRRIFINTGALMIAETPNEIIGVLAHEAGHIAGGHQQRLRDQLARAQTMAVVAGLVGIGAVVGGAASGQQGLGQAGMGVAMGGNEVARRSVLGYQRTEETTADRSAVRYLEATGQSANGMLKTFGRFQSALSLSGTRADPYQISHPMPRDRIANLTELAQKSKYFSKTDSPALQRRHDLMRAKIAAYTNGQQSAQRMLRGRDTGNALSYADAISTALTGSPATALQKVDALIRTEPKNPYYHELRGEVLMRANRPADATKAFSSALALQGGTSAILQVAYGQALVATGKPESLKTAVSELRKGLDRDREYVNGYSYLAQAYGQLGQVGDAELATAEGHFYSGNIQDAKIFAARSQQKFKKGSPSWLRAQDIINTKTSNK